jgi:hypothetical protein
VPVSPPGVGTWVARAAGAAASNASAATTSPTAH